VKNTVLQQQQFILALLLLNHLNGKQALLALI
jgi:hypothetical protein